ncbi:hypothetical protein JCM15765_19500 [Paradesulfitobacterium aromaticivorans]
MNKLIILIILVIAVATVSGCNISQNQDTLLSQNSSKSTAATITETNSDAANIPIKFYEMLNNKQYDEAVKLLGPQLAFMGSPEYRKYLINLDNTVIKNFHDITNDPQVNITPTEQSYYAVKTYYADLDITVKDKNLVPALTLPQHRIFIVVKVTKDGPWLLDSDEACPAHS